MDYHHQYGHAISITTTKAIYQLQIESILYFECADSLISVFHTNDDKPFHYINSLSKIEEELNHFGFIRISHNMLVNMRNVLKCSTKTHTVYLKNGVLLQASRRKWHKIKVILNDN